jgi:hypothetical protein
MPLVPFLPLLGVFLNFYLMTTLSVTTWYRFLVWFSLGNTKTNIKSKTNFSLNLTLFHTKKGIFYIFALEYERAKKID